MAVVQKVLQIWMPKLVYSLYLTLDNIKNMLFQFGKNVTDLCLTTRFCLDLAMASRQQLWIWWCTASFLIVHFIQLSFAGYVHITVSLFNFLLLKNSNKLLSVLYGTNTGTYSKFSIWPKCNILPLGRTGSVE